MHSFFMFFIIKTINSINNRYRTLFVRKNMKKTKISENASPGVTAATSIAAHPSRMGFSDPIRRVPDRKKIEKISYKTKGWNIVKIVNKDAPVRFTQFIKTNVNEQFSSRLRNNYDQTDVISRLKNADETSDSNDHVVGFAMEDDQGQLVKVYVQKDQAENFEKVLTTMMNEVNTRREIADIIFDLRSRFNILDAEWPEIEEDEELTPDEESTEPSSEETDDPSSEEADQPSDEDFNIDGETGVDDQTIDQAESALDKVIDVMKADAEARKAESEARKAEAQSLIAKYSKYATEQKIKDEEEMLEIEAAEKEAAEKDKEAKRIAKLAKYRYDKAKSLETDMSENLDNPFEALNEISNVDVARAEVNNIDQNEARKQARMTNPQKIKKRAEELDRLSKSEDPLDRRIRQKREELARLLKMKQSKTKSTNK